MTTPERPATAVTILHISDPHLDSPDQDGQVVDDLLAGVRAARELDQALGAGHGGDREGQLVRGTPPSLENVDLIALTGDLRHKAAQSPSDAYAAAQRLVVGLLELFALDRDRALIIPGNHDVEYGVDGVTWQAYGDFVSRWYEGCPRVRPVHDARSEYGAYVVDHREELGLLCFLMNSLAGLEAGSGELAELRAEIGPDAGYFGAASWHWPVSRKGRRRRLNGQQRKWLMALGVVGTQQRVAMEGVCSHLGVDPACPDPSIALLHHHLFPVRSSALAGAELAHRKVLLDFPDVTEWLARRNCRVGLHGHRHLSGFARLRSRGLPGDLAKLAMHHRPDASIEQHLSGEVLDLVVTGTGKVTSTQRAGEGPAEVQVVRVVPRPIPRYDVPVMAVPYVKIGQVWTSRGQGPKSDVLTAFDTVSALEEEMHDAELFFTDQINTCRMDPRVLWAARSANADLLGREFSYRWFWELYRLARGPASAREAWFPLLYENPVIDWAAYQAAFQSDGPVDYQPPAGGPPDRGASTKGDETFGGPRPRTYRQALVAGLVARLNQHNRKAAIFGMLPAQLYGLYALGALLFSEQEVHDMAAAEFHRPEWQALLETDWRALSSARARTRTHLEDANARIAHSVREWYTGDSIARTSRPIHILEFGFGALRTIKWVVQELEAAGPSALRYLGIDVNGSLKEKADQEVVRHLYRLLPLPGRASLLERCAVADWVRNDQSRTLDGKIDVLLASYCLHHSLGRNVMRQSLLDGTFFRVFEGEGEIAAMNENHSPGVETPFFDAVQRGLLFPDVENIDSFELARMLRRVILDYHVLQESGETRPSGLVRVNGNTGAFHKLVDDVMATLPDRHEQIVGRMADLVRPGGIAVIADPNGYSRTFNRQQIIHDWPLVLSHFSDWPTVVARLARHGFEPVSVVRQVRLHDLSVTGLEVPAVDVDSAKTGALEPSEAVLRRVFQPAGLDDPDGQGASDPSPHRLEIEDQHLGYVIVARRTEA